jgi:hypothetical protein
VFYPSVYQYKIPKLEKREASDLDSLSCHTKRRQFYVVQSIISWNGRIVALSRIAANTWSDEMVPCPFFSRPRKNQLRACSVFRKNAIVVKGSFFASGEIENVAV